MNINFYYNQIIQTIMHQEGNERRNPIDIGVECGYPEEDVVNALNQIQKMQNEEENTELLYFIVEQYSNKYLVALNTCDWTSAVIREIPEGRNRIVKVQKGILVFVGEAREDYKGEKWIGEWENLKTGEKGTFHLEERVQDIIVLDDGIVAINGYYTGIITKIFFDGRECKKISLNYGVRICALKQVHDDIYVITEKNIWRIDKELCSVEQTAAWENSVIETIYSKNSSDYFYIKRFDENKDERYKCFSLDGVRQDLIFSDTLLECERKKSWFNLGGEYYYGQRWDLLEFIETQDFYYFNDVILDKKNGRERKMHAGSNGWLYIKNPIMSGKSQAVSLYSQNIVVYVTGNYLITVLDLEKASFWHNEPNIPV